MINRAIVIIRVLAAFTLVAICMISSAASQERKYILIDGKDPGFTKVVKIDLVDEKSHATIKIYEASGLSECGKFVFGTVLGKVNEQQLQSCESPASQDIARKCGCGN